MMVVKENENGIIMTTMLSSFMVYTIDYYLDKLISVCKN